MRKLAQALALTLMAGAAHAGTVPCEPLPHDAKFCSAETPLKLIMRMASDEGYIYALPSDHPAIIEVSVMVKKFEAAAEYTADKLDHRLNEQYAARAGVAVEEIDYLAEDNPGIAGQTAARTVFIDRGVNGENTVARSLLVGDGYVLFVYSQEQGPDFTPEHKDLHGLVLANLHLDPANAGCVALEFGHQLCQSDDLVLENIKKTKIGARFEVDGVAVSLSTSTKADWLAMTDAKAIVERIDGVYTETVMGVTTDQVSVVGEDWLDGRAGKRFFTRVFVDNKTDQTGGGLLVASMLHKAPDHVIRVSLKKQGLTNAALLNGALRKLLAGLTFGQ